ncbi:MAG: SIMPL domain-containing protein [Flavobacteriaceae bacterium]|nr:SIMPL domain-containing protein [Flavobacteriaceae bacterium]
MKNFTTIILCLFINTILFSQSTIQPTVSVMGEGIVSVVPDEVVINVQIENKGDQPKELKTRNNRIVNEVLQSIKKLGIEDKNVKTQYVRLQKNYDYQTKAYSYYASQSISIKLTDLSKYELLMSTILDKGINRIDGILFSSSNEKDLQSEVRKKAIENAKLKAEEYASVLNQEVGKAITISEFSINPNPTPLYETASRVASDGVNISQQTLSVGVIEIRSSINVTFLLN